MGTLPHFGIGTQQGFVKCFVFQIRLLGQPARLPVHLAGYGNAGPKVLEVAGPGVVRAWVQELYAERGRPSIDPVVFFKLQLVLFFEGLRSERKLIETASLHLAQRWYLGYALDEPLPDHSSLTRIRQRLGVTIFQRFFERVVDLCQDAGLVWWE